jgi:pyrroline-5-carboxylate reductase
MRRIIGVIGCGNMGEAILAQGTKSKSNDFIICEKDKLKEAFVSRIYKKVKVAKDIHELVKKSDIIIVAVKPQDIDTVLEELSRGIKICKKSKILIISIAAGIKTRYIEKKISGEVKVIRVMPNMPASIGEGITALTKGKYATKKDLKVATKIFELLGKTIQIPKEGLIDAVTALSGSGPAYLFFIFSAMLTAAQGLGLKKEQANKFIYHTIIGSTKLLNRNKFDIEALISKITSKGGTTQTALKVFKERKLDRIITDAMIAAYRRAKKLSRG